MGRKIRKDENGSLSSDLEMVRQLLIGRSEWSETLKYFITSHIISRMWDLVPKYSSCFPMDIASRNPAIVCVIRYTNISYFHLDSIITSLLASHYLIVMIIFRYIQEN